MRHLERIVAYREWHVHAKSVPATFEDRAAFRLIALGPGVRVCALFFDCGANASVATPPTLATLRAAVHAADDATASVPNASARRLVVLLVHADGALRLRSDVQAALDDIAVTQRALMRLETWHARQLAVDVPAHELVAPHRFATATEKQRYVPTHLPLMRVTDPVARWLGAELDDIVVEERDDADTGRSLYLRRVVRPRR